MISAGWPLRRRPPGAAWCSSRTPGSGASVSARKLSIARDPNQKVVLLALAYDKKLALDRLGWVQPFLLIRNTPIVHVNAAAANQFRRFAVRRCDARLGQQSDQPPAVRSVADRSGRNLGEHLQKLCDGHRRDVAAEQCLGGRFCVGDGRVAVHDPSDFARQFALRGAALRLLFDCRFEGRDALLGQEGEEFQIFHGIAVLYVEPELIELIGLGQSRVQPDRARLRLAELGSRGRRDQRHYQAVRLASTDATDQVHPGDDVSPLVAATHLHGAVEDRKSTRLNSSHSQISYAVFCLKKKKKKRTYREVK